MYPHSITPEQRNAAYFRGSHARLLAGPGTGKTSTLAERVWWLTTNGDVDPENILVITFTRSAAAELRANLKERLGTIGQDLPRVSTLHSWALRQLLRNQEYLNLPTPIRVADDYEEDSVIVPDLARTLSLSKNQVRDLLNRLSADWQDLAADKSSWQREFPDPRFLEAWSEHRFVFGYALRAELVYRLRQLLMEQTRAVDLEGPPRFVLVDEYQDLNACDLQVIKSLATRGSEIYCAGDDDQSIYGFRYAHPEGIREFPSVYSPCKEFVLHTCHRCGNEILSFGGYVAEQDPHRSPKDIHSSTSCGQGEVHLLRFPNGRFEANGIAELCKKLIAERGLSPERIMILLRRDRYGSFSKPIIDALTSHGVKASVASNPFGPLEAEDGRRMLSIMRLALNRWDHLGWRTLLSLEKGIGEATLSGIFDLAVQSDCQFCNALETAKIDASKLSVHGEQVMERVSHYESFINVIGMPAEQNLDSWIEEVASMTISNPTERAEVSEVLLRAANLSESQSLSELISSIGSSLGDKEQERRSQSVSIMTVHQAKGLSADAVILAAAEDEVIPGNGKEDEERRLLYVSLTRARRMLFVTYCKKRLGSQIYTGTKAGKAERSLSRFLSGGPYQPEDGISFCKRPLQRGDTE